MIQIENTPNPNALKFLSTKKISTVGTQEFQKKNLNVIKNNFVKNLLNLDGVELILISENFLSVKKTDEVEWNKLKPSIISTMNDYFAKNNKPILSDDKNLEENKKNNFKKKNDPVSKIIEVIDTKVKPAVARDGGDIKFVSFENGTVKVKLQGSCSGCPSSLMTLKQGVQNLLCHYVKEVKSVEAE